MPDLLESIMKPTNPVKEELRGIVMRMNQFRTQIEEFRVDTVEMSGKMKDIRLRLPACRSKVGPFQPVFDPKASYNGSPHKKKIGCWRWQAL